MSTYDRNRWPGPTLTEILAAHGYTHAPGGPGPYSHHVRNSKGEIVCTGPAHVVREWLSAQDGDA